MDPLKTQLAKKELIAEDTLAFYFNKPVGLTFVPGQHASVVELEPAETDDEGAKRTFSFITIPSDDLVGFATRLRDSAFKRNLKNAAIGMPVELINPRGSMVLPQDTKRPLVFLAGGIGITPFMSMSKMAAFTKSPQKITLLHANKSLQEAQFTKELQELAKVNSQFTFVEVITREENVPTGWTGEKGHYSREMLAKYVTDFANTVFYLAGPAGMVQPTTDLLTSLGVDPLFIKSEDFGEYK